MPFQNKRKLENRICTQAAATSASFLVPLSFLMTAAVLLLCALIIQGCSGKTVSEPNAPQTSSDAVSDNRSAAVSPAVSGGDFGNSENFSAVSGNQADPELSSGNANNTGDSHNSAAVGAADTDAPAQTGSSPGQAAELPAAGDSDTVTSDTVISDTSVTSPSSAGTLRVSGAALTDSAGNPVQLRGISTHGLAWFPEYVNEDCFRQLRDQWNVNVIRLAMYTAEYGGYCNGGDQEQLKQLIQNGVAYATALDMYVIIDWHILSDGNPNTHKEEAKAFFSEMAQLYAGQNNVLYEICNEPNGGTSWSEIKSYAEEIIPVIRACDEDAVIIVGTPNWSQYVDQAAADPISGYDNIMYSLHFYAATHKDSLRNTMTSAISSGLPIFVTEYGICDASGNGAIDEDQANRWVSLMDEYGVSYVAWNLSNKSETSAILSNGCGKTSGFAEEDLSASGKWLYQMLTGKTAVGLAPPQNDTVSDSVPSGGTASQPGSSAGNTAPSADQGTGTFSGNDSFTAALVNTWESDGKTFYQYDLTVSNTSGAACSRWSVDVIFSGAIALSDGWNGDYSVDGQTLHIVSKDYNGSIPAGGSAGNIGFIISGGSGLAITP